MTWFLILIAAIAAVLLLPPLRRAVLTGPIFALYKKMLPAMSQTEREALEAGTVWWEGELFSGKPAWQTLLDYPQPKLTAEAVLPRQRNARRCAPCPTTGTRPRSTTTCRPKSGPTSRTRASSA
jgi:hypothetical protein